MSASVADVMDEESRGKVAARLAPILAAACGLIVANLYYVQPLIGPACATLGVSFPAAGLVAIPTQMGYGLGLLLIVPLGDLFENRNLALYLIGIAVIGLLGMAFSSSLIPFVVSALLTGIGSVAVQVLVPFAAHMTPEAHRGRIVGKVMGGLMLGIMLARPIASLIAQFAVWSDVFIFSAGTMILLIGILWRAIPVRVPNSGLTYWRLLGSMKVLALTTPLLQRRSFYQACLFGTFTLFWTIVPLYLSSPAFNLSQGQIALFALAGVAGAAAAPLAGKVADRGWGQHATLANIVVVAASLAVTCVAPTQSNFGIAVLLFAAVALDFSVSANMLIGQRAIFQLGAEHRARLNSLYMTSFYIGGAIGSSFGCWTFARYGWAPAACFGISLPIVALLCFLSEREWRIRAGNT